MLLSKMIKQWMTATKGKFVTIDGRPVFMGGPQQGGGGISASTFMPYSTVAEKEIFDELQSKIPVELMQKVGLEKITVTDTPEPGHAETGGFTTGGEIRVVQGDHRTALHEMSHLIDKSRFGDGLRNIRVALRDHSGMGRIGARERVAVFIESFYSEPGSRANDWVNSTFPDLIGEYKLLTQ